MSLLDYNEDNLLKVSSIIKRNLTPDLLPKKWWKLNMTNPTFGHCHNASGSLYKIFGHRHLHMYRAKDDQDIWHWWVMDNDNRIIDLTSEQYTDRGKTPPYAEGQKSGLLNFEYRKRVLRLTDRVMYEYENCDNNGSALWS